ncbi:hypothetical protein PFISCL1PPCAC_15815 [Pristionchus fissidentatus]|uniref:Uncharacterized protein n=1 Tax=Pristionchus fissidentatus TaxID=1538716 RepID=A0AAV5W1F1_9BILA|nr:hypothetical protein PFISCL1PPCAC_15815 [Pristionchus fissidentatus]
MYRSVIVTSEKKDTSKSMREASSASPPGSSATLSSEGGSIPTPQSPPRCICLNCHKQFRGVDTELQRVKEDTEQVEEDGHARNLMNLINNAEIPMEAPVCRDCADAMQNCMKREMEMLEDDCIKYGNLIGDLKSRHTNVNVAEYRAKIEKLKRDEYELSNELRALILEEEKVDRELAAERRALEQTTVQEEELWKKLRDYHSYMIKNDQDVREINMEIRYIESQLRMLSRTSVLSLAFPIEVSLSSPSSLPMASINGFRLGRLPDVQIDWPEINAAWGQALLLLDILMARAHCAVAGVEFITLHSSSSIRMDRGNGTAKEYPLYASGSWKPFGNKNMDGGACLFMEALALLCNTISEQVKKDGGTAIMWPHRMKGDKLIENDMEYTVKMQFNAEERWTRAMRAMLLNLKWAAAMINLEKA